MNRNHSKKGNSGCRKVNKSKNEHCNLMNSYSLLVTVSTYEFIARYIRAVQIRREPALRHRRTDQCRSQGHTEHKASSCEAWRTNSTQDKTTSLQPTYRPADNFIVTATITARNAERFTVWIHLCPQHRVVLCGRSKSLLNVFVDNRSSRSTAATLQTWYLENGIKEWTERRVICRSNRTSPNLRKHLPFNTHNTCKC